jgi:hypothetical protein
MWRMAGSDRWNFDRSLFEKPAVLRTGFKHFPVCWHLQEYLRVFAGLLGPIKPDDEVVEIVLVGPQEIERFCERDIFSSADIAFSLPAAFSLLISRVEPGPQWYAVADQSDALRYRNVFRYECSEIRSISLRTRAGHELNAAVDVSDFLDRAALGLDEAGVLAKHERLTDAVLRDGAAAALAAGGGVPDRLYSAINSMMMNQHRAMSR